MPSSLWFAGCQFLHQLADVLERLTVELLTLSDAVTESYLSHAVTTRALGTYATPRGPR